jgi:hypothetical protein
MSEDLVKKAVSYLAGHDGVHTGALIAEMSDEILRIRAAKTAALKLADERAIEAVELRAKLESARKALEEIQELGEDGWSSAKLSNIARMALTDEKGQQ